jgi:multidrug resistance efflux pump
MLMDNLTVLRNRIALLRQEIADIQQANEQFRRDGLKLANAQVAHGKRNERLLAIQGELARLADLGRKVISTEQMREKHRARLAKQKAAS